MFYFDDAKVSILFGICKFFMLKVINTYVK